MMTFGIAHSGWPENGRKVTVLAAKAVEETQGKGSVLAAKGSGNARRSQCLSREEQRQGKAKAVSQPRTPVARQRRRRGVGPAGSGSGSVTSSPAPPICPAARASTSAGVSMQPGLKPTPEGDQGHRVG